MSGESGRHAPFVVAILQAVVEMLARLRNDRLFTEQSINGVDRLPGEADFLTERLPQLREHSFPRQEFGLDEHVS